MPATTWKAKVLDGPHQGKVTFPFHMGAPFDLRLTCDDGDTVAVYLQTAKATTLRELGRVLRGTQRLVLLDRYTHVGFEEPHGSLPTRFPRELKSPMVSALLSTDDFMRMDRETALDMPSLHRRY